MSTQPWYATREVVKNALDVKGTAYIDQQVDDAIEAASRDIEQCTNRVFYPWTGTRYLDWPDTQDGTSYVLWLEENEVVSVDELLSGTTAIAAGAYNLEPSTQGPPYDRIELKLSGSANFGLSDTHQRDVTITGTFAGAPIRELTAGQLSGAINDTATAISVTAPSSLGVGTLLRAGTERMIVTGRAYADSGQQLQQALDAGRNAEAVAVEDGTVFTPGEVITIDVEKLRVNAILGNTLAVTRAWDGSTLATHALNAAIYRETAVTVERGAVGTASASHADQTPLTRWVPPGPIGALCRAQAIDTVLQEQGGYARTIGSGDNARNASGAALGALWARVEENFRRIRLGAI